ncbi:MAG: glycosyltransferase family 2 protein [Candidatus Omnitrophota bacterium]
MLQCETGKIRGESQKGLNMKTLNAKVSIIMPAYNESSHIITSIQETIDTFEQFGCDYEIIVMDDGSKDDTYEKARNFAAEHLRVCVKKNQTNFGKGRTLKKAFRHVTGDYVVFLDADLDLHPKQAEDLFEVMRREDADVVIGSKRHPKSKVNYPLQRRIISSGYYYFIRVLFGLPLKDTQTGIKLFKRRVLQDVFPKVLIKRYAFDLELLVIAHHLKYKIAEAPITLHFQRSFNRIKMNHIWHTAWDTLAVFYRMHILRYYDKT